MTGGDIQGRVLNTGMAGGTILAVDEPVSFWGGFDPGDGRILEASHPQRGQSVRGRILVMARGKGSAGTPAGVAESIRNGSGPAAIILREADVNITVGAMVAARLYDLHIPVLELSGPEYDRLQTGLTCDIDERGNLRLTQA